MLQTTTITGQLLSPAGQPLARALVSATLSGYDTDGAFVVPRRVSAVADDTGSFALELWPNGRGSRGTTYSLRVVHELSSIVDLAGVVIPLQGPVLFSDLIGGAAGAAQRAGQVDGALVGVQFGTLTVGGLHVGVRPLSLNQLSLSGGRLSISA